MTWTVILNQNPDYLSDSLSIQIKVISIEIVFKCPHIVATDIFYLYFSVINYILSIKIMITTFIAMQL